MDPWSLNSGHWAPTFPPALHLQAFTRFPKPTDLCSVSPLRALPPGPGHVCLVLSPWNPRAFVPDPHAPWAIDAKVRWNQSLLFSHICLSRSCDLSLNGFLRPDNISPDALQPNSLALAALQPNLLASGALQPTLLASGSLRPNRLSPVFFGPNLLPGLPGAESAVPGLRGAQSAIHRRPAAE